MNKKNADIIVGLQHGDEGKGRIVDAICGRYKYVVRYQGGSNSGHTVYRDGKKFVFHILPSSMLDGKVIGVLGNGMVIDPVILMKEIIMLTDHGVDVGSRLKISNKAHITLPYHRLIDMLNERKRLEDGREIIGSTCRGNSPTYVDKYKRVGTTFNMIRGVSDLNWYIDTKIVEHSDEIDYNMITSEEKILDGMTFKEYTELWIESLSKILFSIPIISTEVMLNDEIRTEKILLEGAQGTMLDVDFGDYPFVTSSHVTSLGACVGSGVPPTKICSIIGVTKLYNTKVGRGSFPSEMPDIISEHIRNEGSEYGSTTGRPRRCGWLDMIALKYAVVLNGVTEIALTKSDIMSSLGSIEILDGDSYANMRCQEFDGWGTDIKNCRTYDDLPSNLKIIIEYIEEAVGVPIIMISVGSEKHELVYKI